MFVCIYVYIYIYVYTYIGVRRPRGPGGGGGPLRPFSVFAMAATLKPAARIFRNRIKGYGHMKMAEFNCSMTY